MDQTNTTGTPGSAGKTRGRRPAAGGRASGLGRGAITKDASPGKAGAPSGAGTSGAAGAPGSIAAGAAPGPSGAGAGTASGLGPTGGVTKRRGRPPGRVKAAGDIAGVDSGPEDAPDISMPYRGTFTKDLSRLMYGFGDYENPIQETINVVEDILVEYVRETCCAALSEAARMGKLERDRSSGAPRLKVDEKDILFLVRKDPKKYTRIRELLDMQILIKEARKTLDVDKISEVDVDAGPAGAAGAGGGGEEDPGEELPDVPDEDLEVE